MRVRLGFLGNAAIASAGVYVEFAVALPLSIIVARSLGPSDFGHYTFAIWLTGWLVTASNNALTMTSIKFIAEARGTEHPGIANHLAHRVAVLQARSTLAVLATFCLAALLYVPGDWSGPNGWLMVAIAVITVWARAGGWLMGAIAKGFEKFTVESVAPVVATSCGLSLVLILSRLHGSVMQFFAAFAVAGLVMNLSARITLRRCGVHMTPGDIPRPLYQRFWKQLLLTGALIVVNLCANRTIETLFLKAYSTPMNLGFFTLAGTLTKGAVDFLAGGLSAVLLPAMARAYGRGQGQSLSNMLSEAIRFYWYLGLLIGGFGLLVTDDIVTLLYGARFAAAIPAVTVTIVASGLLTWGAAINAYQTTSDLQQDRIWITSLTLLVNIIVAIALIPRFGLAGAVGSFAVTRTAGLAISWLFLRRRLALQLPLLPMSKALLATGAAVGVSMLLDHRLHGPGRPLAGALCFLLAFVFLTVVSRVYYRRDFELGAALCGRLGPAGRRFATRVLAVAPRFAADR